MSEAKVGLGKKRIGWEEPEAVDSGGKRNGWVRQSRWNQGAGRCRSAGTVDSVGVAKRRSQGRAEKPIGC